MAFWGSGGLRSCALAADAPAQADLSDAVTGQATARFVCAADREMELQPGSEMQVTTCTLAAPANVQSTSCAAGAEMEIIGANLSSCTLAEARPFDGFDIPAGSVLHLIGTPRRIERFLLPAMASPLSAFGMRLPSNAEVRLCDNDAAVDQAIVAYDAFVEIGGVRLTGTLDFECGVFRMGSLFEDSRIDGETWSKGRTVFRKNLDLPPGARP